MLTFLLAATTLAPAQPGADTHEAKNPLFKSQLETGMDVGGGVKAKFPKPTMPDGLNAAKQKEVIMGVIGDDYAYEDFTRKSVVAPHLLKIRDIAPSDPKAPARGVDVWFVAYGDLKTLEDDKFLDRIANTGRNNGKGKGLTKEELAKRGIKLGDEKKETYGHIEFDFLEKVRLKATGRAVWTRTKDSVLVAAEIDPRFVGDKEYPDEWQSIIKEDGEVKYGPAAPWSAAGFYLKITQLADPPGALFCEQHVIFAEPTGWFNGANLLRSKLPIGIQSNVRSMRKELAKGK